MTGADFLRAGTGLLKELPRGYHQTLAGSLGWLVNEKLGIRRQTVLDNLARLYPNRTADFRKDISGQCYQFFVRAILDWVALPDRIDQLEIDFRGMEHFHQAHDTGRGVVAVTGHYGYWEWTAALLSRMFGGITVYADRQSVDLAQEFIDQHRRSYGVDASYGSMGVRHLLRALDRGELVGVVGDQRPRNRFEFVKFLNARVRTMTIFSYLAEKTGALVVPAVAFLEAEDQVVFRADPPLAESRREDLRTRVLLRQFNAWLEDTIREHPEQYFWLHNRFKYTRSLKQRDETEK